VTVGSGKGVEVTSIGGSGGGGTPTLIGDPNSSGNYSNANSSITNGAHHRFLAGTITIVLTVAGVTSNSLVSAMQFEFGTASGTDIGGQGGGPPAPPGSLPEPSTFAIAGLGALGFIGYGFRRRRLMKT
jgi:hypothetical protein